MPEVISRKEARALGLKRYFTGKPCKRGHISERSVSGKKCNQCGCEWARNHYSGDYYRKNREKLNSYNRRRTAENPEKFRNRNKEWRDRDREKRRAVNREWRAKNQDKCRAKRNEWARLTAYYKTISAQRRRNIEAWKAREKKQYYNGPLNPKDEAQWLRKNRAQLRTVRRYLQNRRREQSESSQPET